MKQVIPNFGKIHSVHYFLGSILEVARSKVGKPVSERLLQYAIQEIFKIKLEGPQLDSRSSS